MTPDDLNKKAHQLIADKIGAHEPVQMHWAVQELISQQGEITGDGVPFFRLCAREHCYRVLKNAVDKYPQPEADEPQPILPGWVCLQKAYTVERNKERVLVPIDLLSDAEILDRANEFERQIGGMMKHAQELREYVARRRKNAPDGRHGA